MDNDTPMDFGCTARVQFLARAENGSVKIYIEVGGDGEPPDRAGFLVSPSKALLIADAILEASALAQTQLPEFPL
jgi:hypothetical protein